MDPLICTLSRSDGGGLADDVDLTDKTKHYLALDTLDFSERGVIRCELHIVGADRDTMVANFRLVEAKLAEALDGAAGRGPWVTLEMAYRTTESVFYDILSGTLTPGAVIARQGRMRATLELRCLPWARGPEVTALTAVELVNGVGKALVEDVAGDMPALTKITALDISDTGVNNRFRWAGRKLDDPATQTIDDFDPWVDVTGLSGTTTGTDATFGTVGANYIVDTVSATTFSPLARAVMPAGALNRGKRDVWGRILDTATAMAAPTGLGSVITGPTITEETTEEEEFTPTGSAPAVGLNVSVIGNTGAGTAVAFGGTVTAGSTGYILATCLLAESITTPTNWTLFTSWSDATYNWYLFTRVNFPAAQTSVTVAHTNSANPKAFLFVEVDNALSASPVRQAKRIMASADPIFSLPNDTDTPDALALILSMGDRAGGAVSFWTNGVVEAHDTTRTLGARTVQAVAASLTATEPGPFTTEAFDLDPATIWNAVVLEVIRAGSWATVETTVSEVVEPAPGELMAGAHSFKVRAIDPVGTLSTPSTVHNKTIDDDRSKAVLSWTAPAAGTISLYELTWSDPDGECWRVYTDDNSVSYVLTGYEGAERISALPTTGDAAPPARMIVKLGTLGGVLSQIGDEIILTGAGAWRDVLLASARDWPPAGRTLDDSQPEWASEYEIRSANGRDVTVRLDAIWTAPHDESQSEWEYAGLALATKRRWIGETDRRGQHTIVRLEHTGTSAEVGAWDEPSPYLLATGTSVVAVRMEQAAGLSDVLNAIIELTLSYFPRYTWQREE